MSTTRQELPCAGAAHSITTRQTASSFLLLQSYCFASLVVYKDQHGLAPMTSERPGNSSWQSAVVGSSPKLANAMEVAMAAGAEVSRVSRRIFQKIWDPEPINGQGSKEPVWCLGCSYTPGAKASGSPSSFAAGTPPADNIVDDTSRSTGAATTRTPSSAAGTSSQQSLDTPPDSIASSFDSSLAYEEPSQDPDRGWPPAFLDDFESRIWMTYRTEFELIPRSADPKATSALSFAMRLKTSFGDQTGFSSDTGWGCMIRSGQSLLANALLISRLGRGMFPTSCVCKTQY